MFINVVKNQHFISQVEQRFNAIDSKEPKQKQRIFEYKVNHESQGGYEFSQPSGVKISKNLSWNDLYTYEYFDQSLRHNLEIFFGTFESRIYQLTNKIISEKTLSRSEFQELVAVKIMNIIRNPYCIKENLELFSVLVAQVPTDKLLIAEYLKIDKMQVNNGLILELGVSEDDFKKWLKIIFHLVMDYKYEDKGEEKNFNILRALVDQLFDLNNKYVLVSLFSYDKEVCLLSDKGHNNLSRNKDELFLEFNLTKNDFIVVFAVPNTLDVLGGIIGGEEVEMVVKSLKKEGIKNLKMGMLEIKKYVNEIEKLKGFNTRTIQNCYKNFYSASKDFLL